MMSLESQIDEARVSLNRLDDYIHALRVAPQSEQDQASSILTRINEDLDTLLSMAADAHEY